MFADGEPGGVCRDSDGIWWWETRRSSPKRVGPEDARALEDFDQRGIPHLFHAGLIHRILRGETR